MDKAEEGVMSLFRSEDKKATKNEEINKEKVAEENQSEIKTGGGDKEELKTYSKFDFIPGEKIIFFDNFADESAGDFPLKWNTTSSGEIITTNNRLLSGKGRIQCKSQIKQR